MIVALAEMRSLNCLLTAMDLFVIKENFIHSLKVVVKSGYGHHFENRKIRTTKAFFMYNNDN